MLGGGAGEAHHHTPPPFRRAFPSPPGLVTSLSTAKALTSRSPSGRMRGLLLPVCLRLSNSSHPRAEGAVPAGERATFPQAVSVCPLCMIALGPHRKPQSRQQLCYSHFTGEVTEAPSGGTSPAVTVLWCRTDSVGSIDLGFQSCGLCTRPNCLCQMPVPGERNPESLWLSLTSIVNSFIRLFPEVS